MFLLDIPISHAVENQGNLKSCAVVAVTSAYEIQYKPKKAIDHKKMYEILSPGKTGIKIVKIFRHMGVKYKRIEPKDIKDELSNGKPVIISMWYSKFKNPNKSLLEPSSYEIPYDRDYSEKHAMVIIGYNEHGYIVENSWGKDWGDVGRFILPYEVTYDKQFGVVNAYILK